MIGKLNNDNTKSTQLHCNITANKIAHQLLLNGKTPHSVKQLKPNLKTDDFNLHFTKPFSLQELKCCISTLKNGKATGLDHILTEELKHFGPKALNWLFQLYNNCIFTMKIPKIWLRSRVIALLKPGKDPALAKSYCPKSLLSHSFKLMERLLLNRLSLFVEEHLIDQQDGFRLGKSTTGQLLILTQYIEDGLQEKKITGAVFVDLTAAYDTVNHRRLPTKILKMTKDPLLTKLLGIMLRNRNSLLN